MSGPALERLLWTPLHSRSRWAVAAGAAVAGVAHIQVIGPHLREAPYMGEEFIVLTAACLLLALAAVVCDSAAVYLLTVMTCGLAVAGYAATRLVAFPLLADDVGNWLEPLGVLSVCAETVCVIAAGRALWTKDRHPEHVSVVTVEPCVLLEQPFLDEARGSVAADRALVVG